MPAHLTNLLIFHLNSNKRKHRYFRGKQRYETEDQDCKPSQLAVSREARKAIFDKNRSKRIAAMIQEKIDFKLDDSSDSSDTKNNHSKFLCFRLLN